MAEPDAEMRNPFRNEADAFRILVMFIVAAAIVIAAAIVVGTWLGVILALAAIAAGIYATIGWLRVGLGERTETDGAAGEPAEAKAAEFRPREGSGSGAPDGSP